MTLKKCPRCELNYILDGGALCTICRREVKGEQIDDDIIEMCSECGENPVVPGYEYCSACLKEKNNRHDVDTGDSDDIMQPEDTALNLDNSVSELDEIAIDTDDDAPFGDDDDEDMDDDGEITDKRRSRGKKKDIADDFEKSGYHVVDEDYDEKSDL